MKILFFDGNICTKVFNFYTKLNLLDISSKWGTENCTKIDVKTYFEWQKVKQNKIERNLLKVPF